MMIFIVRYLLSVAKFKTNQFYPTHISNFYIYNTNYRF